MPKLRFCATALVVFGALLLSACGGGTRADDAPGTLRVTATTNVIADLAAQIGGELVEVTALMGPGVDPHLYKASAGDVERLADADVIFYGGLELEGRMSDLLDELSREQATVAVTRDLPESRLLTPSQFQGRHDPHVWFDVALWKLAAGTVADTYRTLDPAHAGRYEARLTAYLAELDALDAYIRERVAAVPERSRVLVTSHDAFNYFGRAYGFEVEAIQGVSTQAEATTADIERIAGAIADRQLRSVFIESSVPRQTIDAVLAAAASLGWQAEIGGELYSDSAGDKGTPEGTYVGMLRHNVDAIVEGLS